MAERLLHWLKVLQPGDRLVKVKSWMPWWDGKYVCWPTMLVDRPGTRMTIAPCWNAWQVRALLRLNRARP